MKNRMIIVCDNIRSAYNIGALFRTADSLGSICEIYLCGISPTPSNPKVAKTSLGAENSVKWRYFNTLKSAIYEIDNMKIPVYVLEQTKESKKYNEVKYPDQVAIVLGNEIKGVNLFDVSEKEKIEIPMNGIKESLNVEVSAAIVMFHIVNQWKIL